ncbi:hypothetical protein H6F61_13180 [Cyanobacteria bacterium FACHB-472]|nr:hypothetical protein [Cyanobacteria bacterium FACHB-472]
MVKTFTLNTTQFIPINLRLTSYYTANSVLSRDEVHVWCASLDQSASLVQQLATTLSADEQLRADRFRFEQHRQHFIIGRGVLRAILGRYMNIEPSQLQFSYSPHAKPALADVDTTGMLQFGSAQDVMMEG